MTLLQTCLNGTRSPDEHSAVPVSAAELADDAIRALAAGADELTSDGGAPDPVGAAAEIDDILVKAGVTAPQLHHGGEGRAWDVLDAALARGRDIRIGLEDTTVLPDGSPARDNAELVAEARRRLGSPGVR